MTTPIGATVPIVAAVAGTVAVTYAEIVSSMPARAAGPEIRANLDDLIETTCAAVRSVGARQAKVISLLSPAEPSSIRSTVYCLVDSDVDRGAIAADIQTAVTQLSAEVPGFRLKQAVQFESVGTDAPLHIPEVGRFIGTKVTVLAEVVLESDGSPT